MSLQSYTLTPEIVLRNIIAIVRPHSEAIPRHILTDLPDVDGSMLDMYFQRQKLVPPSTLPGIDSTSQQKLMCLQLYYGVNAGKEHTQHAIRLLTLLVNLKTRCVRFAAVKLVVGMVDVLVDTVDDPTLSPIPAKTAGEMAVQMYCRFLSNAASDVYGRLRILIGKYLAKWCVLFPQGFKNANILRIFADGLLDNQGSVRNEYIRQIKSFSGNLLREIPNLMPILQVYAEFDNNGGSINRRSALQSLQRLDNQPSYDYDWCVKLTQNCLKVKEPVATVVEALKLASTTTSNTTTTAAVADSVTFLLDLMPINGDLLGNALVHVEPIKTWDAIVHFLARENTNMTQKQHLLQLLTSLVNVVPEQNVYALVGQVVKFNNKQLLQYAALVLKERKEPQCSDDYFKLADVLIDLQVREMGAVVEQWTFDELDKGGCWVLNKVRQPHVPLELAGWVNGDTQYKIAAKSRWLLKGGVDWHEMRAIFDDVASTCFTTYVDKAELEIALKSLARVYASLNLLSSGLVFLRIDASWLFSQLQEWALPLTATEKNCIRWLQVLEDLGGLKRVVPVSTLFHNMNQV